MSSKDSLRVMLLDGSSKTVPLSTNSSAREICDLVARKLDLFPRTTCALYERKQSKMRRILDTERLSDVMSHWDDPKEFSILIKHKLIFPSDRLPTDPLALHFLYIQAVDSIKSGMVPVAEDEAIRLAALVLFVTLGPFSDVRAQTVVGKSPLYIPTPLFSKRTASAWESALMTAYEYVNVDTPTLAMRRYLEAAQKCPLYGVSVFLVAQLGTHPDRGNDLVVKVPRMYLGVSQTGIMMLSHPDKQITQRYLFADIASWANNQSEVHLTVVGQYADSDSKLMFNTYHAPEIVALLQDYAVALVDRKRALRDSL